MSRGKQSPIFVKTYDFLVWLLGRSARFPKNERFRMARRLEETAFAFYDLLLQAGRLPASQAGEKRRLLSQRALLQFTWFWIAGGLERLSDARLEPGQFPLKRVIRDVWTLE